MLAPTRLVLLALLGAATPALAQDGSPWGDSSETTKTAPRGEEPKEEEAKDEGTVTAPRGEEDAADGLPLAEEGAEIARIELAAEPATAAPGATVEVSVVFWTEGDKAIPGVVFDLLGKGGEVGDVTEDGGRYTASFTVGVYTEDEAKLSVITDSGMHEMLKLSVEGDAVEAPKVAAAEPTTEPKAEKAEKAEKVEKEPKEKVVKTPTDRDPLWLHARAQGAGGFYSYAQTPDDADSGPLIEDTLAFGGDAGSPANAAGLDLSGTVWLPDQEYLGFQAHFRMLSYSVQSNAFEGAAVDYLYDAGAYVVGRIPVDLDMGRVWGGARLGFHYDDFLLFAGCLDPGCQVNFETVGTPGVGLGPRGGLEMGPIIAELGYSINLARATQPYGNAVDLNVGAIVFDPVTVELGVDYVARTIVLLGKDSGDVRGSIKDGQTVITLGVGTVF